MLFSSVFFHEYRKQIWMNAVFLLISVCFMMETTWMEKDYLMVFFPLSDDM